MNFLNFNLKKIIIIAAVLALPLFSINMQQNPTQNLWFTRPLQYISSLSEKLFFDFSYGVKSTASLYLNLINIKKEILTLKTQNNELASRLQQFEEVSNENNRLKSLLTFKESAKMQLVAAQAIGRDLVIDHNSITINKGSAHGIKSGMAVITTQGVLGYIFKPQAQVSHVMLITDRYAVVDGIIQRTRAHGIVEGKSQKECLLKYVEKSDDVRVGDLVVTGGLDNIFPKGFPIGIVKKVEDKSNLISLKIDITPTVDPLKVEEVFVIINANNIDVSDSFASTDLKEESSSEITKK